MLSEIYNDDMVSNKTYKVIILINNFIFSLMNQILY